MPKARYASQSPLASAERRRSNALAVTLTLVAPFQCQRKGCALRPALCMHLPKLALFDTSRCAALTGSGAAILDRDCIGLGLDDTLHTLMQVLAFLPQLRLD